VRVVLRRVVSAFAVRNRHRKARIIREHMRRSGAETVIFVGAASGSNPQDGIVERQVAAGHRVVSVCNVVPPQLPWNSVVGDGRRLPYRDACVDVVVSNAVIEHVGGERDQRLFVDEHCRVGRTFALTTPNRLHPVEPHTSAVLRHWSREWRARHEPHEFTRLLSRRELVELLPPGSTVVGRWWSATFVALGPMPTTHGAPPPAARQARGPVPAA
jgi:hypothetical protein